MNYHEIIVNFYPEEFEYSKKSGQRKNNSWKNYSLRLIKLCKFFARLTKLKQAVEQTFTMRKNG